MPTVKQFAAAAGCSTAPLRPLNNQILEILLDREPAFVVAGAGFACGSDATLTYPFLQHELLRDRAEGVAQVHLLTHLFNYLLQRRASRGL